MKTGPELHKRNDQLANLFNTTHIKYTVFAERASWVQKAIKKKFAAQLATKKPCGKLPGTFCVLTIIQNSGEGVDPKTLKQMTGFNKQKVHKILYKLFKHGEIRIKPGGLYTGVKEHIEYPLGE
jgi:predicted Rossmann fold nucleotide-binding protein DprA/Smf involved in DNA uptake